MTKPDSHIKQAVIFAGGRGERLRPLTDDRPKPMVLINGRPFLEYLVELLKSNGIEEIVMLLGYKAEKIVQHFGDGNKFGINIKYSIGTAEDETGTRLKRAYSLLRDEFLLLYSDNYLPFNLKRALANYRKYGVLVQQTVYNNKDKKSEYGTDNNVRVEEDGFVSHYGPRSSDPRLNSTDTGFFIVKKEALNHLPKENVSFQTSVLPELIQRAQLVAYRTDHPYYYLTSAEELPNVENFLAPRKVIFLDRDGVINKQMPLHDYVKKWSEFEFLPGVKEALGLLIKDGYEIYVITNQRGISRGLMTEKDLKNIHEKMKEEIADSGGEIVDVYYCPHGIDENCECRKPKPGMFYKAARDHNIDLSKAIFIGDSETDRKAGEAADIKTIIIKSGSLKEAVETLIK